MAPKPLTLYVQLSRKNKPVKVGEVDHHLDAPDEVPFESVMCFRHTIDLVERFITYTPKGFR